MDPLRTDELPLIPAGKQEHEAGGEEETGKRLDHADNIETAGAVPAHWRAEERAVPSSGMV
jgi:hypothetical protein